MARYGVSPYGTSTYGEKNPGGFAIQLSAQPSGTTTVRLDCGMRPAATFTNIRVTRNHDGDLLDPDGGVLLFDDVYWPGVLLDTRLAPGTWSYYSVFVYLPTEGSWVLAGQTSALTPVDNGGVAWVSSLVPGVVQSGSRSPTDQQGDAASGLLAVLGFGVDQLFTSGYDLLRTHNLRRCCYALLPAAMADLGIAFEPAIGPRQNRRWAQAASWLARRRGTVASVVGAVRAITGWDVRVAAGANLVWSGDLDGSASNPSLWSTDTLFQVRGVAAVPTLFLPDRDQVYLPSAAPGTTGPSSTTVAYAVPNATADTGAITPAVQLGIPVTPGTQYTYAQTFYTSDLNGMTVALRMRWLDAGGVQVGELVHTDVAIARGVNSQQYVTNEAPANAAYFLPAYTLKNIRPQGSYDAWGFAFGAGAAPTTDLPGQQNIALVADRVNLVRNPSAEVDTAGWATTGSAATALDNTGTGFVGTHAFNLTLSSPGAYQRVGGASPAAGATTTVAATAGKAYLVDVTVQVPAGSSVTRLVVGHTDVAGNPLDAELVVPVTPGAWTSARLRFVARPTNAVVVGLDADPGASGSKTLQFDAVLVEAAPGPTPTYGVRPGVNNQNAAAGPVSNRRTGQYFDGGSYSTTGEFSWAGTPHASVSMFHRDRTLRAGRLSAWLPQYLPLDTPYVLSFVPA